MRRRGITMLELMVVVVVVGILTSFLFPVFAKSKEAAAKASCLVNSKELALATALYEQDHHGRIFPFGYNQKGAFVAWWGDLKTGDATRGLLYPYTKSGQIRGCPSAADLPNDQPYPFTMGYGMNFRLFFRYPPALGISEFISATSSEIERPGETILCGDTARLSTDGTTVVSSPWLFSDSANNHLHALHARDVANVTWLDGHASSHKLCFTTSPLGIEGHTASPIELRSNQLGDLLKFPKENPNASISSYRDQFYYLLQKPAGT